MILVKFNKLFIALSVALIFGYLFSFYYASAVLRLPLRVAFPFLIIFCILIIFNLEITIPSKQILKFKFIKIFAGFTLLFIIGFATSSQFGLLSILKNNNEKLAWAFSRDFELKSFNSESIYIAPTAFLPATYTGPFLTDQDFPSLQNTIITDWSTFSPAWNFKVKQFKLNPENLFKNLAKTKDVYLVSDDELSSIIDMYMNDNNILRGKKCSVFNLTGSDNAKIFTFQGRENQC